MEPPVESLPTALSPSTVSFLNTNLHTKHHLSNLHTFASHLHNQLIAADRTLVHLNQKLEAHLIVYSTRSGQLADQFSKVNSQLNDLRSCSDGGEGEALGKLGEELPALAKEVARVETVRAYAETALKLDNLVGDIEDAVSSVMNRNLRKHSSDQTSEEMRVLAISSLKLTEDVLSSVALKRPQWKHLVSAADHRVDRALSILRPHSIAGHRALLASLGWPPPLSTLNLSNIDTKSSSEASNPLFTMQGDLKRQYCENFLALCSLQELQRRRKSRQLMGYSQEVSLNQPLWAIEELVLPISVSSQRHFSKWNEKPEFIFALVYKITRDYVDSMDELLQPLVDKAMLTGYSCREEWISAMVTSLSTYLAKEIFPNHISQLDQESAPGVHLQASVSWLNLMDLMIAFDKRTQSLLAQSGIFFSLQDDGNRISSFSVFCDRPDWLDFWAEIELRDLFDKLKPEIENERNWIANSHLAVIPGLENYKSPSIADHFVHQLSYIIERCRSLPNVSLRSRFLRLAGIPLVQKLLEILLLRCQEAEGLTALTDDNDLIKVTISINSARYFESVLKEWCTDLFFIELGSGLNDSSGSPGSDNRTHREPVEGSSDVIFEKEIRKLEEYRKEWVEKTSVVVLRGFDAQSRDYIKNRKQWQENVEEGWVVSKALVGALDYLQRKISVVEENLNRVDFVGFWRMLAVGVDRSLFNGILMNNVKFPDEGVERLSGDFEVLFGVFGAWCVRPDVFFPKASEGLKLLKLEMKHLKDISEKGEEWLKEHRFNHLSFTEAERIAKSRVFTS